MRKKEFHKFKNGFTLMKQVSVREEGFTLIELLVVISIIGILIALSIFGLQGARAASRDARRKSDLEQIRSAVEIYKSDCNSYPSGNGLTSVLATDGVSLKGDGISSASCDVNNVYLSSIPEDPTYPSRNYRYFSLGTTYELCASLENTSEPGNVSCGSSADCGSGADCNYKVTSP